MRRVSRRDPHLRVSDGTPRLLLLASPNTINENPTQFLTTCIAYNLADATMMLEMIHAIQPALLLQAVQQITENAKEGNR